ncbi:propionate CoA-transferase [Rhodopseudomonas rhenobacensis]|uniref:Acetate CoA-transferase YdiF n=1 Tax=Rhodopseudomonas rhenobacensis TaxID=87461 RepID=A0A7W8E0S5_9BRAD|nr:CoA-transferase [Rhodopseudomonas rhenobacensis]MBB5049175.1 propionate CoA-transferase [Rhodopseudomonas rhenobacensis]
MSKIVDAATAVASIRNGSTLGCVGVIGWVTPDALLKALGDRFRNEAGPRDLTFYFPVGTGDAQGIKGMDHVAQEGLMKRIVGGSYINPVDPVTGKRPELMRLIRENKVEAYSWPIGATMHWLREVARRSPGYMTRVGLDTYIDPKNGGGKFTECAEDDLVKRIAFEGEDYLFYPAWKLDTVFICASSSDQYGNLSFESDALVSSNIALALAAKGSGGRVIAQVRREVAHGTRPASEVRIPGMFVDAVVVDPQMMMTTDVAFDPAYFSGVRRPLSQLPPVPMSADKVVAMRAAQEVRQRELSIFGFGAAADIPLVMAEQGKFIDGGLQDYWFTTEHGSYGGIVMPGWQFSANLNPDAILDGIYQFDAIDGGLCEFAALAFAQFDSHCTVNVSKFGVANPGAGGFIDIAENAKRLVFTGTFTTGGLEVEFDDGKLRIVKEGKVRKFVPNVEHITYSVASGIGRGQTAKVVTERAVFEVAAEGLILTEVAPGIDVRRDVLGQMEFAPLRIADQLREMDAALFASPELQAKAG